jgi:hypothetical protein
VLEANKDTQMCLCAAPMAIHGQAAPGDSTGGVQAFTSKFSPQTCQKFRNFWGRNDDERFQDFKKIVLGFYGVGIFLKEAGPSSRAQRPFLTAAN